MLRLISTAIHTAILAAAALAVMGCSKSVITRKDQEAEFKGLFRIAPTAAVVDIRYHEASGVGGYQRWMSFTWDAATYDVVLKTNGYKLSESSMAGKGNIPSAPIWWPKTNAPQAMLYSRSQDDTPEDEGFQFLEFMWHDPASGRVYFSKSHWD